MVDENTGSPERDSEGLDLSQEDRALIEGVDRAIHDARELQRWWVRTDAEDAYDDRFELSATHNRPDRSFGFFGQAEVSDAPTSVMGNVQEQLYDRPKTPGGTPAAKKRAAAWMNRQVREFVLRYFLRVSDFRQPDALPDEKQEAPPPYLRPLSWMPEEAEKTGFGFEQVYYKKKDEEARRFAEDQRYGIVDLRKLGETYEWLVLKVDIFDFEFVLAPFGPKYPYGAVPGAEQSYLVLSADFVLDEDSPADSTDLGRYGFGYAFLPASEDSILAYGPGRFEAAYQGIQFHVRESGEVISRMTFVANRPDKVVNVSADPVSWGLRMADLFSFGAASPVLEPMQKMWQRVPRPGGGVDVVQSYITLANMLSGGAAERNLGVSRKQLHKNFLVKHFQQHYNVVAGTLPTWRQIPDWLDRQSLPDWVVSGTSASTRNGDGNG